MSLRHKTILFVALVLAIQFGGLLLLVFHTQMEGFAQLEDEFIAKSCDKLRNAVTQETRSLARITQDYLRWDDSWAFIESGDESFVHANFSEESMANLGLDICIYMRNEGTLLAGLAIDMETGAFANVPDSVLALLDARLGPASPDRQPLPMSDIAALPEGVLFFAIQPATMSDGSGPINGFALFGRWLDMDMLARFEETSHLSLSQAPDGMDWPESSDQIERPEKNLARISISILDSKGGRVCLIIAGTERSIYTHGQKLSKAFILWAMGLTLLESLIILLLMHKLVLRRLFGLSAQLRSITSRGDSSVRLQEDSHDELGTLAADMNELLGRLHQTEEGLRESIAKEKSASRAKSQFLANMSHEIRTPMNGIMGMLQLLEDTELGKTQLGYVTTIGSSCEVLMTVINDILNLSKVESDAVPLAREPILLQPLLDEVMGIAATLGDTKKLTLACEPAPDLPTAITCDPNRLKQVLLNLLSNACKFTEKGHVKLKVSPVAVNKSGYELLFEVEDTGIGIAKELQERIFEPFVQIDSSFTRKSGGTGLGLTICRNLVRQMGGSISVESAPRKGATFRFSLKSPLTAETQIHKKNEALFDPETAAKHPLRILLAEDNNINKTVALAMLRKMGYSADLASNGMEAHNMALEGGYDVILMDVQMPLMDGLEATERIRRRLPRDKQPIIIALTAHALPDEVERCLKAGMWRHMNKPLKVHILHEVLVDAWKELANHRQGS